MTYRFSLVAFALGALVVGWAGLSFIGSNLLALTVTLAIAAVYASGFAELARYQQATATLNNALAVANDTVSDLDSWIARLHPSLHTSVRMRIQGEHLGLPQPVMSPYLVGLLVMLGMLGTFVGMVDTLKGAVSALEGTTDLEAIRTGLAAPIKGLGMAFGTSVAGVAASAMLGFISTLSRRERMLASRQLDLKTQTAFQPYSLRYNRQQAFKAMQDQADTLPSVAARLEQLSNRLENMGEQIGQQLVANQAQFHESARSHYQELARSVGQSLQENLAQSGKLAGESLQPIVSKLVQDINDVTATQQQKMADSLQQQFSALTREFSQTSAAVSSAWQTGINSHQQGNAQLQQALQASVATLAKDIRDDSKLLLDGISAANTASLEQLASSEQARFSAWLNAINASQQASTTALDDMARSTTQQVQAMAIQQESSLKTIADHFSSTASSWMEQWHSASQGNVELQQSTLAALARASNDITGMHQQTAIQMGNDINRLLAASEQLLEARTENEAGWLDAFNSRMDSMASNITGIHQHTAAQMGEDMARLLAASEQLLEARSHNEAGWLDAFNSRMEGMITTITGQLDTLHEAEAARTQASLQQLASLQQVAREQLASLGAALEEPMGNLIRIASETPKAAAEVIANLRAEISNNIERDNTLLEERRQIMADLQALNATMASSSEQQKEAIAQMVTAASESLLATSDSFVASINGQLEKMSGAVDHFTGSAVELSSLGEAFGMAVELFSNSNAKLEESLAQIQQALHSTSTRSDEQLAYYVAQAREIIDHSMLSQQEIISQIRQLGRAGENA